MNNSIETFPWAPRHIVTKIKDEIQTAAKSDELLILLILGKAGFGKTYVGRALGVSLGSGDGHQPGSISCDGKNLLWSGLLDVFDTETNSNQGLEQRLILAFDPYEDKFHEYNKERDLYDLHFKTGILGPGVEAQRRVIERAFGNGMANVCEQGYPVIALDTIERLESASDPVQRELKLEKDTASVVGWLLYQLKMLPNGAVLFFGRERQDGYFQGALEDALPEIEAGGDRKVRYKVIHIGGLEGDDRDAYFAYRLQKYPQLKNVLTPELKQTLCQYTESNPLLLDIVLLLLEKDPQPLRLINLFKDAQREKLPADQVQDQLMVRLLGLYHDLSGNPDQKLLLDYLAVARNGLFPELITGIDPQSAAWLQSELEHIEELPFIKVRSVFVGEPGSRQRHPRKTYFLHDELYRSYDRRMDTPGWIAKTSAQIEDWYDNQVQQALSNQAYLMEGYQGTFVSDMLVESLLYRLRANLRKGYQWFLAEEDRAIRTNLSVGLDMRMRDGIGQFVNLATEEIQEPGRSLSSVIDRENPELDKVFLSQYYIDTAMLWVKRTSARGNQKEAVRIGKEARARVEAEYKKDPTTLAASYAEFCLWFGQALMYLGETQESQEVYRIGLSTLQVDSSQLSHVIRQRIEEGTKFDQGRICLVVGRLWNNLGYLEWINIGRLRLAISYFQQAKSWYLEGNRVMPGSLDEELANTNDNLGRVNGLLGYYAKARDLVRRSLKERKEMHLRYRAALSGTSLAIVLAYEGQLPMAEKFASESLLEFQNAEADRGTGLGLITHAMILRNQAETWRENEIQFSEAKRMLDNAEIELRRAEKIFNPEMITETIRRVQLYNELGCNYRALYLLMRNQKDTNPRYLEQILKQGAAALNHAIDLAMTYHYSVERLDSLQDLAVLYFRARQIPDAEKKLQEIEDFFSDKPEYLMRENIGLLSLSTKNCVDPYYKILGQVEMLRGSIEHERGLQIARKENPRADAPGEEVIKTTIRHYLFAVEYFHRYSGEAYSMQRAFDRMYSRLESCTPELVEDLLTNFVPELRAKYTLSESTVRGFFEDIFGRIYQEE